MGRPICTPTPAGGSSFSIHGRPASGEGGWELHASGRLVDAPAGRLADGAVRNLAALERALPAQVRPEEHYARMAALGIELGPAFRTVVEARRRDGEALATVVLPPGSRDEPVTFAHPCLLDGALQTIGLALPVGETSDEVFLFTGLERLELSGPLPARLRCHARLGTGDAAQPAEHLADLELCTEDGTVVGSIRGARLRRASRDALARAAGHSSTAHYEVVWEPAPPPRPSTGLAALAGPAALAPRLRERFSELAAEHGLAVYAELLPGLDRLSAAHLAEALRQLGWDGTLGRTFSAEAEAVRLGVVPRHRRLFARLCGLLAEDGVLRPAGGGGVHEVVGGLVASPDGALERDAWKVVVDGTLAAQFDQGAGQTSHLQYAFNKDTGTHRVKVFKNGAKVTTLKVNTNKG